MAKHLRVGGHKTQDTNIYVQAGRIILLYPFSFLATPFPSLRFSFARDPPHEDTARHHPERLSWGMIRVTASLRRTGMHLREKRGVNPQSPNCMSVWRPSWQLAEGVTRTCPSAPGPGVKHSQPRGGWHVTPRPLASCQGSCDTLIINIYSNL